MINILIADDHKLFRETLCAMLNESPGIQVTALCSDAETAVETVTLEQPAVALMDINIMPFSGIEATRKITAFSNTKVIGLSMYAHTVYAKKMMQAGAKGYITKNSSKDEIVTAVKEVMKGNKYLCHEIRNMISENVMNDNGSKPLVESLTEREIEIINLIKEGLSSKEICCSMDISVKTVEVHRHNILKKLKLKNASNLVNYIYANAGFAF